MLQNAYFLAKIGADTAENEQHFAEILPKTGNYPTDPYASARRRAGPGRFRGAAPGRRRLRVCREFYEARGVERRSFLPQNLATLR